jgi:uncharacterized protein (DUF2141 family)
MLKWVMVLGTATVMSFITMPSNAANLTVTVEQVRNSKGEIRFSIFNVPSQFPQGNELDSKDVPAQLGFVTVQFYNLVLGAYAIAIHHDENSDGEMNTNFIGLPKEGYGFSNNAKVNFAAPAFEAAAFNLDVGDKSIRLRVVY